MLDRTIESLNNDEYVSPSTVLRYLTELKTLRESALRPADKFLKSSLREQFDHILTEVDEADLELYFYIIQGEPKKQALVDELVDVQSSCETLLAKIGLTADERNDARRRVIAKNARRHYYEVAK